MRQQGAYPFCVKNAHAKDQSVSLCGHEQYFALDQQRGIESAQLLKFTIPASVKRSAMRDLERLNITEASRFETQDATARTLFRRTIQWFDDQ